MNAPVAAGAVMRGSKLPLSVWFWAAYLMATHFERLLRAADVAAAGPGSYKSDWLLCAKLRRAMSIPPARCCPAWLRSTKRKCLTAPRMTR